MHWYGGSIAEAVTLSKQKNAIFVVFVEDDNELSAEMSTVLEDGDVLKRLSDPNNFLAIKLKSGSTNYTHFAQIYQFVPVPSLFFIGRNGTPLEVVCAGVQPNNLASRIDRILEEHNKDKPAMQPSTSGLNIREQTASLLQSEAATSVATAAPFTPAAPGVTPVVTPATPGVTPVVTPGVTPAATEQPEEPETSSGPAAKIAKMDDTHEIVCDGDVCVRRPRADGAGSSRGPHAQDVSEADKVVPKVESTESSISAEEKMERAKELIEAKRREKAEKEKQLEKEKEQERRNLGQGVAELKRWQADQELKQIQEERKREKMENNLARQRILEQIAQDRAERRARDAPAQPAQVAQSAQTAQIAQHPPASGQSISEQIALERAERRARYLAAQAQTAQTAQNAQTAQTAQTAQVAGTAPSAEPAAGLDTSGDGGARARIQFKLPDGSSHTAHFDADGCLADVQRYVSDNLQLSSSQFSLWTAFPRRELTEADATLRRLELAPSAALVVLPRRATGAVQRPTPVSSIIAFLSQLFTTMILQPSQRLYTWFLSHFSPPPSASPPPRAPPAPGLGTAGMGTGPRRRGNVHRLTGDTPDDENNTWNGNSTQQM